MKKNTFCCLAVVLGIILFAGCATQNVQSARSTKEIRWIDIRSIADCVGEWEGFASIPVPEDRKTHMPEFAMEFSIELEYQKGAKRVNGSMIMKLDNFLDALFNEEIRREGYTKDELWEIMAEEFTSDESMMLFEIGRDYCIIQDLSDDANAFFEGDSAGKFQIAETGDQMKLMFYEPLTLGLGDSGLTEIILTRK